MAVRRKHIRSTVERLLVGHNLQTAPVPVEDMARALGVDIRPQPAEDSLSGFLLRDIAQRRAVIGVNSNHHPNRQRFTVAHELGHFLLHEGDRLHVDRIDQGLRVKLRDENSSAGTDDEEKEANLFAAELLMPAALLERDLAPLDGKDLLEEEVLQPLARQYGVSTQALMFRLAYLGYVQI